MRTKIDTQKVLSAAAMVEKAALFDWLISLPAVKAQAYFWNHSSRSERKKAMRTDMMDATL